MWKSLSEAPKLTQIYFSIICKLGFFQGISKRLPRGFYVPFDVNSQLFLSVFLSFWVFKEEHFFLLMMSLFIKHQQEGHTTALSDSLKDRQKE